MEQLATIGGIAGVGLVVLAYLLVSSERLSSQNTQYHLLNFSGSVLILLTLFYQWNLPSFVIQTVWIIISLYGLWRSRKRNSDT